MSSLIIWDIRSNYYNYPEILKNIYKKIYYKNYKKFNILINKISKDNRSNINWWLNSVSSRDERISKIFHYICVLKTLEKFSKSKKKLKIILDSINLQKIILKKKYKYIEIKIVKENTLYKKIYLVREFLIYFLYILAAKVFAKKKNFRNQKITLIDMFDINLSNQKKFYFGEYLKNFNQNLVFVPTYTSLRFNNLLKTNNKKNVIIKEKFIKLINFIFIIKNFFFHNIEIKNRLLNKDLKTLFYEEINSYKNIRSKIMSYINYLFFKNLKEKKIQIKKIISWHENQIIDKGWSLGVRKYFPKADYIGYQGSTLHPQFFNLSPTSCEFISGVVPKKIILVGRKYKNNRQKFFKKIKYSIEKKNRFNFEYKKKEKYILFLLTGFEEIDKIMIKLSEECAKEFKNIRIKFHPIYPSKFLKKKCSNEILGKASKIISSSKIVITSSYTSGLYESLAYNLNTILLDFSPFDSYLRKDLQKYTRKLYFSPNINNLVLKLRQINKYKNFTQKHNNIFKKLFFNK